MSDEFEQEIEGHIEQFLSENVSKELVETLMAKMRKGATKYGDKAFQACRENAVNADMMKHANEELMDFILYMGFLDWQIKNKAVNSTFVPLIKEASKVCSHVINYEYISDYDALCPIWADYESFEENDPALDIRYKSKLVVTTAYYVEYVEYNYGVFQYKRRSVKGYTLGIEKEDYFECIKCGRYEGIYTPYIIEEDLVTGEKNECYECRSWGILL
jgi:hypothetical protein